MMLEAYERPEMSCIWFEQEDIITTSDQDVDQDGDED